MHMLVRFLNKRGLYARYGNTMLVLVESPYLDGKHRFFCGIGDDDYKSM